MRDYRRLVSYIYAYNNDVKGRNVGFAKIDVREQELRMRLSLRVFEHVEKLKVYFFEDSKDDLKIYPVCEVSLVNGMCNQNISRNIGDIRDSRGISTNFDQIEGIFLCDINYFQQNDKNSLKNVIYGSKWTDIPIDVVKFRLAGMKEQCNCEEKTISKDIEPYLELEQCVKADEMQQQEQSVKADVAQELERYVERDVWQDCNRNVHCDTHHDCEVDETKMDILDPDMPERDMSELDMPERDMLERDMSEPDMSERDMPEPDISERDMSERDMLESDMLEADMSEMIVNSSNQGEYAFYEKLCSLYPRVQIRELDGECIQITPHDIKLLPSKYWQLENNSFLLHGYYNYRHIIIWKREINGEIQYILGVPGLFHPREQTIANMYGFPGFEGNRRGRGINFGYWCVRL